MRCTIILFFIFFGVTAHGQDCLPNFDQINQEISVKSDSLINLIIDVSDSFGSVDSMFSTKNDSVLGNYYNEFAYIVSLLKGTSRECALLNSHKFISTLLQADEYYDYDNANVLLPIVINAALSKGIDVDLRKTFDYYQTLSSMIHTSQPDIVDYVQKHKGS